jgi:hypothetical protein
MTITRLTLLATALALTAVTFGQELPPGARPTSRPDGPSTRPGGIPSIGSPLHAARRIAKAHGVDAWTTKPAVRCTIDIRFGGEEFLRGTMLYDPHDGRVRIELADDGPVLVFDGRQAWSAPAADIPYGPRFHLLTWPYFLAAPFKLEDPGTRLERHGMLSSQGKLCETIKLTFTENTGDSPDDWYIVYVDPGSGRMVAMAYIVTYGTTPDAAEAKPHAIEYSDFRGVEGVTFATRWTFRLWSAETGINGPAIGVATLSDIEFVEPKDGAFSRPDGAVEDKLP